MDITFLSILLLTIAIIFALIAYVIHLKRNRQQQQNESIEITDIYDDDDNPEIIAIRNVTQTDVSDHHEEKMMAETENTIVEAKPTETPSLKTPSAVLAIYVMAKNNMEFVGYELLQTLLAAGFRFGDMSIFHRHEQLNGSGKILFSLACATEPGVFDINRIGGVHCQGLSLFMRLTDKEHNFNTLNLMLDTAYQIAEELDGIVLNPNREPMTHDAVLIFKQKVEAHLKDLE